MSVILEFSLPATEFQLGEALSGTPMQLEIERIVPTGDMIMPFVWATGDDHDSFAEGVRSQPNVRELFALDRIGESGLYRIEWDRPPLDLLDGIATAEGVVLEARGHDDWTFRLRFSDHDNLSTFHNYVIENDVDVHIDRTYTLTEATGVGRRFDLSEEQREALLLALREGYFETPSETSLNALADELDISRQAFSDRIRRGNEKILREVLLSSGERYE
ncbi:helix-turn-helix domain-containing protein [Natrialba swarupiae]|uniref:Bacterio-opsin activator n=1 Tax=Natrialba swarupiae TaxID=2448032 RepID=A0A5D5AEW1_9EURY|nr:helix-turn-helix domain-containing protein [Natrialba swarupiae]TYT60338.1 bacterio-opsin activator [Natrialba swarupiae]